MEQSPADQDGEAPEDDGEVFEGPPSWVQDAPVEAWEDFERVERETSDAQTADDAERFLAASPEMGEGESFGWFAYAPGSEPPPSAPAPDPPPPSPTGAVTLHRVGAGGEREQMVVSRVVSRIQAVGAGVLRLVFHPTGPVYTADDRGGYFVDYPQRIAEVDVSAALPATLDLDAAPSRPVQDEDDNWEWDEEPAIDEADRVGLSGIAGTRWSLRPISAGDVEAAVAEGVNLVGSCSWLFR